MAVSKVKRSIHLAQPQPQRELTAPPPPPPKKPQHAQPQRPRLNQEPTEQMPVRAHVYRTIAEMNGGFEHVIDALQTMQKIKHLPADSLSGIENQIALIRAEANRGLMAVLSERELANAGHFQRLAMEPENDTRP